MYESRQDSVHIWPAGPTAGKPATVLVCDLFGKLGYSGHDWPGKIAFSSGLQPGIGGGAAIAPPPLILI